MQSYDCPEKDAPEQEWKTADCQQNHSQSNDGHVVILRDPNMKLVFGQIRDVTGQCCRVMMHRFAHQYPTHMGPPLAIHRRMRITLLIGMLVMDAMRCYPENRPALQGQHGAGRQKILNPLWSFVTAMRQQPVIAHTDPQAASSPVEKQRDQKSRPGKEE